MSTGRERKGSCCSLFAAFSFFFPPLALSHFHFDKQSLTISLSWFVIFFLFILRMKKTFIVTQCKHSDNCKKLLKISGSQRLALQYGVSTHGQMICAAIKINMNFREMYMVVQKFLVSSSTFGLDSLRGEHQAVCSWKCFCGLARCLSALPGTRPQRGLGLESGSKLEALSELAAPPWSKMSRRPTWLVVSCNWYNTIAALEGKKRKLRCVWACGEETGKHKAVEKKK